MMRETGVRMPNDYNNNNNQRLFLLGRVFFDEILGRVDYIYRTMPYFSIMGYIHR